MSKNAASGGNPHLKTTAQAFGEKLHTYTIVDAINDGNVLPFRIDYINTMKQKDTGRDKQVTRHRHRGSVVLTGAYLRSGNIYSGSL